MKKSFIYLFAVIVLLGSCAQKPDKQTTEEQTQSPPVIEVFYKEQDPSLETFTRIKELLNGYTDRYDIYYLLITDEANAPRMAELGLPIEHFPFAVAIDGKTSANIDGETIVFAKFPDFMHHIGKHPGNWTIDLLIRVLEEPGLMLNENPNLESNPSGQ